MPTKSVSKRRDMHTIGHVVYVSMSNIVYWSMLWNTYNHNYSVWSVCTITVSKRRTLHSYRRQCVASTFISLFNKILILFFCVAYLCQCPNGYYGTRCEYRNYCIPNPCSNNGACIQTTTGYICQCSYPYTGTNCQQSMLTYPWKTIGNRYHDHLFTF